MASFIGLDDLQFLDLHSLRRTCVTRLYRQGADDQQIMSMTRHRSIDGLRMYKEIGSDQEEEISKMIRPCKKLKKEDKDTIIDGCKISESAGRNTGTYNFNNCTVTFH